MRGAAEREPPKRFHDQGIFVSDLEIDIALVDADVQGSSSEWARRVDASTPIYRFQTADQILDEVKALTESIVVIDGPAGLGEVTRATLLVADIALIPCGPSVLDLQAANQAVYVLGQVHRIRGEVPVGAFILNKLQKNYRLSEELLVTSKKFGLDVTPGLGLRQAIRRCRRTKFRGLEHEPPSHESRRRNDRAVRSPVCELRRGKRGRKSENEFIGGGTREKVRDH